MLQLRLTRTYKDSHYYLGVDIGIYGGWVEYGVLNIGSTESIKTIVNENCVGLIQVDKFDPNIILLTGSYDIVSEQGKMYILNGENVREIYDFQSCPQAYLLEDETLYIKTFDKIYTYKTNEEIKVLYDFSKDYDKTYDFRTYNLVKRSNSLFFGSVLGIFEYQTDTQQKYWYPIRMDE
ncbi:MAG: hypothetical protein PHV95_10940 [Eubacteriales bacterium]|nr:hypothetical protein [Eubacteriales bacterium]